ncbi:hypothetical protein CMI37_14775 [Candidatus Pacearchaeota archaeon]|nr:hypothetical protein [Candidatus Pacearchaeota archaeon]|tara:strand:+ start:23 stop:322 length:300 start_codon:yes stop_codon:yes gene_type:complete
MYNPLDFRLTISESDIEGLGLFAIADIPEDICLGISHIENERFKDGYMRTPLGGFYNHSNSPNCKKIQTGPVYSLWTLKAIKKGEEITVAYTLYKLNNK